MSNIIFPDEDCPIQHAEAKGDTIMDKNVDTFEQDKHLLLASFRNFKKHLFLSDH